MHEVTTFYNMYNQQPVGQVQAERLHQLRPASCATAARALQHLERSSVHRMGRVHGGRACSRCSKASASAPARDAPVMLVNDRARCAAS
ncbi:MAG: NAD(P)H-dependent oxidoreductase subunit E [Comamonadaceae bacterium]|nr:NAD(P)H-dependent oxidoreductase subunit E [Comamonadaceae bacterium]